MNSKFAMIPSRAIIDDSLTPNDLRVLNVLALYHSNTGWVYLSYERMAGQAKCEPRSARRAVKKLIERGYLVSKSQSDVNKRQMCNLYCILYDKKEDYAHYQDTSSIDKEEEYEHPPTLTAVSTREEDSSVHLEEDSSVHPKYTNKKYTNRKDDVVISVREEAVDNSVNSNQAVNTFSTNAKLLQSLLNSPVPIHMGRLRTWEEAGYDFGMDVYATIEQWKAKNPNSSVSTLSYFEQAIAKAYAARIAPVPVVNSEEAVEKQEKVDKTYIIGLQQKRTKGTLDRGERSVLEAWERQQQAAAKQSLGVEEAPVYAAPAPIKAPPITPVTPEERKKRIEMVREMRNDGILQPLSDSEKLEEEKDYADIIAELMKGFSADVTPDLSPAE